MVKALQSLLFPVVFILFAFSAKGQIKIKNGTTVTILPNTLVTVEGAGDSLTIEPGAFLLNNGVIEVGDSTTLAEAPGFPIKGSGKEITTRTYSMPLSNENIAGFGAELSSAIAPGLLTLTRTHGNYFDSLMNPGIKRAYHFTSSVTALNATLRFRYDSTELNGLGEPDLIIHESFDNGLTWTGRPGSAFPSNNLVQTNNVDSLGFYTLFVKNITSMGVAGVHCEGEQFQVYVNAPSGLSTNNTFLVQLSDASGNFSAAVTIGSVQSDQSVNIPVQIPAGIQGGLSYRIRVLSTDAALFGVPSSSFEIRNLPIVPSALVGPNQVCNDVQSFYYSNGSVNADSYNWYLTPSSAGMIQVLNDTLWVTWDTTYSGNVSIGITSENNCGESAEATLSVSVNYCLGMSGEKEELLSIIPNPASDYVEIRHKGSFQNYSIFTINGEKVQEGVFSGNMERLNLNSLATGIYYLKLTGAELTKTQKLVIR